MLYNYFAWFLLNLYLLIGERIFPISGYWLSFYSITLEQAKHQKPNSNDYGVLELDGAFAIYWKPNYITIRDDHDKQIVTAALQRKYDALK